MNNLRRRILNKSGVDIDPATGRGFVDGYEVVDLGLPNGLLFATCNVGASIEIGYGNYYMYGKGSKMYNSSDSIYKGTEDPLSSYADTATQVMGSGWRMPIQAEFQDLINKTNYSWTTINGINGGKFTSKTNPNAYVFFPAAGAYIDGMLKYKGSEGEVWSSTPGGNDVASSFGFFSVAANVSNSIRRESGFSVRGVHAAV